MIQDLYVLVHLRLEKERYVINVAMENIFEWLNMQDVYKRQMLHKGHIRLLERARALGDYLIVGVTSDTFDRARGKINVKQSLQERIDVYKRQ